MKKQQACPPKRRGSGLVFAVVLLFVILGMVVTLASVTVLETKMSQKTKSSVGAFYNSESGVEWALNKIANSSGDAAINTIGNCPFTGCRVLFLGADGKVLSSSATIDQVKAVRSVGTQGGETQRAIEAAVAEGVEGAEDTVSCSSHAQAALCCKTDYISGATECQRLGAPGWGPAGEPWPAGEDGRYQIACGTHLSDPNALCCRTNDATGTTECKRLEGPTPNIWVSYGSPF